MGIIRTVSRQMTIFHGVWLDIERLGSIAVIF